MKGPSRRELSVAGLRSTGDLLVATQPLSKVLPPTWVAPRQGGYMEVAPRPAERQSGAGARRVMENVRNTDSCALNN